MLNRLVVKLRTVLGISSELQSLIYNLRNLREVASEDFLERFLWGNPRYQDPLRLNRHEFKTYSQHGEDGIIEEIFSRIGVTNRFFVEFGCENGLETNSTLLLVKGWNGLWLEGNPSHGEAIRQKFKPLLSKGQLKLLQAFITAENIERLLTDGGVPREFDLLSIDLDGNDYWVWNAIQAYRPRVVVIEYNAIFKPPTRWIMAYNAAHRWEGSTYYNSSLKSLELLGDTKGYKLVGCDFSGVNAFFVREDLVEDRFLRPFTAENHYERPRAFLARTHRHTQDFGAFLVE